METPESATGESAVAQTGGAEQGPQKKDEHDETESAGAKCRCGCVPDILSLFEMAALRARLRQEKEKAAKEKAQELQPVALLPTVDAKEDDV